MLVFAQQLGKFADGSVAGNFVVLDALCSPDEGRVHDGSFVVLLHGFRTFLHQSFHPQALLASRFLLQHLEDLLQPRNLFRCLP